MPEPPRLVFVGGSPRSGTTLVQHILDSHPAVLGGPEFDAMPAIVRLWEDMARATRRGRTTWWYDEADLNRAFTALVGTLLLGRHAGPGIEVVSEKTPGNVLVFEQLAARLPDARFVLVRRDPRAVAASLRLVAQRTRAAGEPVPRPTRTLADILDAIARHADAGAAAVEALGDRLHLVDYEQLVAHPRREVWDLCRAVGLDPDEAMLRPEDHEHPRAGAGLGGWRDPQTDGRPLTAAHVDLWRTVLNGRERRLIAARFAGHPLLGSYLGERGSLLTRTELRAVTARPTRVVARRLAAARQGHRPAAATADGGTSPTGRYPASP